MGVMEMRLTDKSHMRYDVLQIDHHARPRPKLRFSLDALSGFFPTLRIGNRNGENDGRPERAPMKKVAKSRRLGWLFLGFVGELARLWARHLGFEGCIAM